MGLEKTLRVANWIALAFFGFAVITFVMSQPNGAVLSAANLLPICAALVAICPSAKQLALWFAIGLNALWVALFATGTILVATGYSGSRVVLSFVLALVVICGLNAFASLEVFPTREYQTPKFSFQKKVEPREWHTYFAGLACIGLGIFLYIFLITSDVTFGGTIIFFLSVDPAIWMAVGILVFLDNRFAFVSAIGLVLIPFFLAPWISYLAGQEMGLDISQFDYLHYLIKNLRPDFVTLILKFSALAYTGWVCKRKIA
jgi:hypothetical protein